MYVSQLKIKNKIILTYVRTLTHRSMNILWGHYFKSNLKEFTMILILILNVYV